jgi:hypothetical protein
MNYQWNIFLASLDLEKHLGEIIDPALLLRIQEALRFQLEL